MSESEHKEDSYPGLLSLEFHTRFFPALLLGRLRPRETTGSGFTSTLGLHVLFFVCLILVVIGIPNAVSRGSVIGWITACTGAVGVMVMLIGSILSSLGRPPSWDGFLKGVFLFFISLGISAGVFTGSLEHSFFAGLLIGSAGFVAGYLLGLLFGLWAQYLGWLSVLINGLAGLAGLGMLFVDLVLLW